MKRPDTPLSPVGDFPNPVFKKNYFPTFGLLDQDNDSETFEDIIPIEKGTLLSYLGCEEPTDRFKLYPFRWGDGTDEVYLPIHTVDYVWGSFGVNKGDIEVSRSA